MITVTLQFQSIDDMILALGTAVGASVVRTEHTEPVDFNVEVGEKPKNPEAEVVKTPAPAKTKGPAAKKATKGTAQKKNEAQARAAAKAKAAEQEVESGDLGLDETTPTPAEPVVTKKEVDTALRAYAQQYQMTGARALIALFKKSDGTPIANARELREEDYAAFVAAAQKAPVAQEA